MERKAAEGSSTGKKNTLNGLVEAAATCKRFAEGYKRAPRG